MKNKLKIIFLLFIVLLCIPKVNAATNPYSKTSSYGTNCVWYVWNQVYNKKGIALPGWGNAKSWYSDAKKSGYSVGSTPKAGSIVVWGSWTSYGHVGYVESISSDGKVMYVYDSTRTCYTDEALEKHSECIVNETTSQNDSYKCDYILEDGIAACPYGIYEDIVIDDGTVEGIHANYHEITGFIYLNSIPKTNKKSSSSSSSNKSSSSSTTKTTKSSNTNIKKITIQDNNENDIPLEFNKDQTEYTIEVENEVEIVTINTELESSKSTLEGNGNYNLEVGENLITLKVTAEDKTTKEYKINITRKEIIETETQEETTVENKSVENKKSNKKNYLIIGSIILLIFIIVSTILIFIIRSKKKQKISKN